MILNLLVATIFVGLGLKEEEGCMSTGKRFEMPEFQATGFLHIEPEDANLVIYHIIIFRCIITYMINSLSSKIIKIF